MIARASAISFWFTPQRLATFFSHLWWTFMLHSVQKTKRYQTCDKNMTFENTVLKLLGLSEILFWFVCEEGLLGTDLRNRTFFSFSVVLSSHRGRTGNVHPLAEDQRLAHTDCSSVSSPIRLGLLWHWTLLLPAAVTAALCVPDGKYCCDSCWEYIMSCRRLNNCCPRWFWNWRIKCSVTGWENVSSTWVSLNLTSVCALPCLAHFPLWFLDFL